MKKFLTTLLVAVSLATTALWGQTPDKIRTMVIAGQDGSHWWKGACDAIKQILENSGLFTVDFCFTPGYNGDMAEFRPQFDKYDLIVINYGGTPWIEEVQQAFEKYVREGGGVVFIHSSVIPMENWQAWNDITGLGAWNGRNEKWGPYLYMKDGHTIYDYTPGDAGYHGLQHQITVVNRATEHPILKGLPVRWRHYKDEIYTKLRGPARNVEILSTALEAGRDEPLMWTVKYGKGRSFVDVMGHCGNDPNMIYSMTCSGYQITFLRGCEWAATGKVTQPVPADFPLEDTCMLRPDFKAPFNAFPE